MADERVSLPRGNHDGRGAAAVFLLVLSLLLGLSGGLMLIAALIVPPLGPEDEISDAVWALPLVLSVSGIVVALVGRSGLIQIALVVLGALLIAGSVTALMESVRSRPAAGADMFLGAPLLLGLVAIGLGWRDRRRRRGGRAAIPAVST
jgi:hypothetical protein